MTSIPPLPTEPSGLKGAKLNKVTSVKVPTGWLWSRAPVAKAASSTMRNPRSSAISRSPRTLAGTRIQFSSGELPQVNECRLAERRPFGASPVEDFEYLAAYREGFLVDAAGNVDWNGNGRIDNRKRVIRFGAAGDKCRILQDHDDAARIAEHMALALPSNPRK